MIRSGSARAPRPLVVVLELERIPRLLDLCRERAGDVDHVVSRWIDTIVSDDDARRRLEHQHHKLRERRRRGGR